MIRLLEYLFILYFLLSLIPSIREYFKKGFRQFFIYLGAMFLIVSLIMTFYVYPRLLRLYQQTDVTPEPQKWITYLILGLVIAILIIVYGIKRKNLNKLNNTSFYIHFGILLGSAVIFLELIVNSVILPIFNITTTLK